MEKLKEGDEVLFILNNRKLMEKVTVEAVDKKNGYATLANKVKVSRIPGPDGSYSRIDGKEGQILPLNEDSEKSFQVYQAYFALKRNLEILDEFLKNNKDSESLININKSITKVITKYL